MAIIDNIEKAEFDEWYAKRPPEVQKLINKIPPNRLYFLSTSGHRVVPLAYSENGTLTVVVTGEYNSIMFERKVFGINPDDLTECDLPTENECVGAVIDSNDKKTLDRYMEYLKNKIAVKSN